MSSSGLSLKSDSRVRQWQWGRQCGLPQGFQVDRQYEWDPKSSHIYWLGELESLVQNFDDVASTRGWDYEKCLDMLLSKLQGPAGDNLFVELSSEEHTNYKVLIKHLKHWFCKVESAKTYVTVIWRQNQRASKTEKAYVAELKCIYGNPYPNCDCSA